MKLFFNNLSVKFTRYEMMLGRAVLTFGILLSTIGFAAQIYKNYLDKANGISMIITLLALAVFMFRIPYSITKKAWHLIPADFCGVVASVVLVVQWFIVPAASLKLWTLVQ